MCIYIINSLVTNFEPKYIALCRPAISLLRSFKTFIRATIYYRIIQTKVLNFPTKNEVDNLFI